MKVLKGILRIMSWCVYAIILITIAIASPMVAGYKPVVVLSSSMEPEYPVGSVTYYKEVSFEEISVGDAITFNLGEESLATHRVVEIDEENRTFVTKGDHNESNDSNPISYTSVRGETVDIAINYAGYFIMHVQTWKVMIPCGVILLLDIISTSDRNKNKKFKENEV